MHLCHIQVKAHAGHSMLLECTSEQRHVSDEQPPHLFEKRHLLEDLPYQAMDQTFLLAHDPKRTDGRACTKLPYVLGLNTTILKRWESPVNKKKSLLLGMVTHAYNHST